MIAGVATIGVTVSDGDGWSVDSGGCDSDSEGWGDCVVVVLIWIRKNITIENHNTTQCGTFYYFHAITLCCIINNLILIHYNFWKW